MPSFPTHNVVFCTEPHCRLPVGRIVDSSLVIVAKHHGEKHCASIPLAEILKLICVDSGINLLTDAQSVANMCAESGD